MRKLLLTLVIIFIVTGCKNQNLAEVSIIQLISSPNKYHNKRVRIIGVAKLEFEGDTICLSKEDLKYSVTKNCLWLSIDFEDMEFSREEYHNLNVNGKYSLIEGVFNKNYLGHMGLNSGSINNISRFAPWFNPPNNTLNKDATNVAPIS